MAVGVNTGTTIVTSLMVFLIQHTQNRATCALQLKLDELILASKARNTVAAIEDEPEEVLHAVKEDIRARVDLDARQRRLAERQRDAVHKGIVRLVRGGEFLDTILAEEEIGRRDLQR